MSETTKVRVRKTEDEKILALLEAKSRKLLAAKRKEKIAESKQAKIDKKARDAELYKVGGELKATNLEQFNILLAQANAKKEARKTKTLTTPQNVM